MLSNEIFKFNNSKFVKNKQTNKLHISIHNKLCFLTIVFEGLSDSSSPVSTLGILPTSSFFLVTLSRHGCPFPVPILCFHFSGHSSSFTPSSIFLYSQPGGACASTLLAREIGEHRTSAITEDDSVFPPMKVGAKNQRQACTNDSLGVSHKPNWNTELEL